MAIIGTVLQFSVKSIGVIIDWASAASQSAAVDTVTVESTVMSLKVWPPPHSDVSIDVTTSPVVCPSVTFSENTDPSLITFTYVPRVVDEVRIRPYAIMTPDLLVSMRVSPHVTVSRSSHDVGAVFDVVQTRVPTKVWSCFELTEVVQSVTDHEPDDVSLASAVLVSTVIETPDPTLPYALEARVVV